MKTIATIIFLVAAAFYAPAADTLNETLQKGLFEEEANHNLDAAIKAYQSVIQQTEEQRKLAATAVFRLGECYRKLGRTNEAAAQYQRVLSEFLDQPALANLSRQNLVGLGMSQPGQEPTGRGTLDKYRALTPTARGKLKELLQEQIKLAEKNLAEQQNRIKTGTVAPEEVFRFQKEVLSLKREVVLVDGLSTPESREQWRRLVLEEIDLAEKTLASEQKKFDVGRTIPSEVIARQQEVLALKRELLMVDVAPDSTVPRDDAAAPVTDEEEKEVKRIRSLIQNSPDLINAPIGNASTPLHAAAIKGQLTVAKFLLANKADVNARDGQGATPLLHAAYHGHKAMVELLLTHGADVNAVGWVGGSAGTALHFATSNGYRALAETLLSANADVNARNANGETPLHLAAQKGVQTIALSLLAKGADVNAEEGKEERTPLHFATAQGQLPVFELLLARGANLNATTRDGSTPLAYALDRPNMAKALLERGLELKGKRSGLPLVHYAVRYNKDDALRLLLTRKPDMEELDYEGFTALQRAVLHDAKSEGIRLLLEAGANPNRRFEPALPQARTFSVRKDPGDLNPQQVYLEGLPPLIVAVRKGNTEIVAALLEGGADVDAASAEGKTALLYAVETGSFPLVTAILKHKPNTEVRNRDGYTPLLLASLKGDAKVVEALIQAGANVNARFARGDWPALHRAVMNRHKSLVELLLTNGADPNAITASGEAPLTLARQKRANLSSVEQATLREIADLLLKHGADETVQRRSLIAVSRRERDYVKPWFIKGTNAYNRHTLYEVVATFFSAADMAGRHDLPFPDFSKVSIRRLNREGTGTNIVVDLEARLKSSDCAQDVPLEWGDIVDVPEQDHSLTATWPGLEREAAEALAKCLARSVEIIVKGRPRKFDLPVQVSQYQPAPGIRGAFGFKSRPSGSIPA